MPGAPRLILGGLGRLRCFGALIFRSKAKWTAHLSDSAKRSSIYSFGCFLADIIGVRTLWELWRYIFFFAVSSFLHKLCIVSTERDCILHVEC